MTTELGWAALGIEPDFDGFGSKLNRGTSKHMLAAGLSGGDKFGTAAGRSAGQKFGSIMKTAGKAAALGLAAVGVAAFKIGKDSVVAASDLDETLSKTSQIFGAKSLPVLEKFGDTADKALGQSKQSALDAISTFGVMGKVAGLQGPKLGKFATRLTTLSSDMASFSNTSPEEAITAIGSALRGEAEPIRKYGVLLDDATLKAEALALGILKPVKDEAKIKAGYAKVTIAQDTYNKAVKKSGTDSLEALKAQAALGLAQSSLKKATEGTIPTLTAQQKVLASQSAIYKQTSDLQGDFTRTSGGLANQQRTLAAQFENAKAKLGKGLLPIVTDAATFLNNKALPAFEDFSDWFTEEGAPAIGKFATKAKPLANSIIPALGTAFKTVRDVLKDVAPLAKDVFDAFNKLPDGAKKAIIIGAGAGVLAKKSGLLGSKGNALTGSGGGLLGLVSKAKPVPVFVTNPGGVAGAGGAAAKGGLGKLLGVGSLALGLGAGAAAAGGFFDRPLTPESRGRTVVGSAADKERMAGGLLSSAGAADRLLEEVFGKVPKVVGLGVKVEATRKETKYLDTMLGKIPPAKIVRFSAPGLLAAITQAETLERLLDRLNGPGNSSPGALAAHNQKLVGDTYNFNGVNDVNAARRELTHAKRAAAMGGADFR